MDWVTELLRRRPAVSWWDLLDVLLVSILIYELLLLIRGTRAMQMALGGGFLIALFFVSEWLDLETVNWVIRNLATYVVFAIIVLISAAPWRTSDGRISSSTSSVRRATMKRLKSWWWRRRPWRRAALARSS